MLSIGERARQTKALWVMMLVIKIKYSVGKFWLRRDIHPQAGINFIYGSRPEELVRIVDHCTYSPPDGRQRWRVKNHLPWKIGLCVFERHPSLPGIKERNHSAPYPVLQPWPRHNSTIMFGRSISQFKAVPSDHRVASNLKPKSAWRLFATRARNFFPFWFFFSYCRSVSVCLPVHCTYAQILHEWIKLTHKKYQVDRVLFSLHHCHHWPYRWFHRRNRTSSKLKADPHRWSSIDFQNREECHQIESFHKRER